MTFLDILDQILHAIREALATGLDGRANDLRIGGGKIARAYRIRVEAGIESQPHPRPLINVSLLDEVVQRSCTGEISLLERIVVGTLVPHRVLELTLPPSISFGWLLFDAEAR